MLARKFFVVMSLFSALLASPASQAEPVYTVHILDASFRPIDINNAGQIAGTVGVNGHNYAALFSGGVLTNLGTLDGPDSYTIAMNEAGDVTGWANGHAFLYQDGTMRDIGPDTTGYGINARGHVVGVKFVDGYRATSFVYRGGAVTELPYLGTGTSGAANDINDRGAIVGYSEITERGASHAYLYSHGALTDLGTLAGGYSSFATDINNAGQVAGFGDGADGVAHAFRYQGGVMTDLGAFGGRAFYVEDMNEHGVVLIGSGAPTAGTAFISVGDALVELSTLTDPALGWTFSDATGINDLGQIVGMGCREGTCYPVRLDLTNAIPEPASSWLLLPGLLVVAGAKRRRRRAAAGVNG